jgi:murein DD-endopeptidase MepM/ murein hydrolase activator NlpD
MKYQIIEKYAQQNLVINFVKGWEDKDGNIPIVVNVSGKKFGLVKLKDSGDWYYWLGIGSGGATRDMPAGRGDYLIGQKLEQTLASKLDLLISSGVNLEKFSSSGASWTPSNQSELEFLANLIDRIGQINNFLSQNGLLYTGGDKAIYGEDITKEDIMKHDIVLSTEPDIKSSNTPNALKSKNDASKLKYDKSGGIFGGSSPKWITNSVGNGYEVGPQHHQGRSTSRQNRYKNDPERNWYSDNAWDVLSPSGTQIYSLTDGKITSVKQSASSAPNIYGIQIIVAGQNGYPDIFYTHTDSPAVSVGDVVKVGDPIAQIGLPKTKEMPHHVHIGLPPGVHISSLMSQGGQFKSRKNS